VHLLVTEGLHLRILYCAHILIYSQLKAILKVTNNDLLRAQLALEVSNARIGMSSHVI